MFKSHFIGGIWPVVQRELREGARRPFNYWLRVGAGAAGVLLVVYVTEFQAANVPESLMGLFLFPRLHFFLMGLICLMVPCMTADCIAREKREGTLGLLFLTPLTPGGIVAGKGLAQGLRALTLWVSVAPVLTIPFVMGGVQWASASAALALEFSVLVLCLAAGLLASTLVKGRGAALLLALILGGILVSVFCWLICALFLAIDPLNWLYGFGTDSMEQFNFLLSGLPLDPNFLDFIPDTILPGSGEPTIWVFFSGFATVTPKALATANHLWNLILWASPIPALLLFALVLRFAARSMAHSWRDKIPSPRQESLVRTYCTPIFQRWFARSARRKLDRNPIAWLQQYSWKARIGKWVLCLAFVVAATMVIYWNRDNYSDVGTTTEPLFLLTIAAGMTFAGISSFAEEKRSGALELILVTPIPVNQIIFGRVWGVWKQFLPAALILVLVDAAHVWIRAALDFDSGLLNFLRDYFPVRMIVVCGLITLPVFALYFTLRVKNSILAAGLTWAALLLPPLLLMPLLRIQWQHQWVWVSYTYYLDHARDTPAVRKYVELALVNLALAVAAFFLLRRRLSRRLYSF
jgi:ABC-type Na+ efflux pump permease subunit